MGRVKALEVQLMSNEPHIVDRERGTIQFVGVPAKTPVVITYPWAPPVKKRNGRKGKRRGGAWWVG